MRIRLAHKAIFLVAIPLVCEMIMLSALLSLLYDTENKKREAEHARQVVEEADMLLRMYMDAGAKLVQYGLTHNQEAAKAYPQVMEDVPKQYQRLRDLTHNNPHQQEVLDEMKPVLHRGLAILTDVKQALDENRGSAAAFLKFGSRKKEIQETVLELKTLIDKYIGPEMEIDRTAPERAEQAVERTIACVKLFFVINVVGGIILAMYVSRNLVSRLQVLSDNSMRLAKKHPLLPVVAGRDEIAEVDQTFHNLADALAEAEKKEKEIELLKRDFLSMVSHDLRTPLTTVLSSTTLLSHGVYGSLNEQGQQRTKDIERELHRLMKLIDDLLDIGKMEAGKFVLGLADASLDDIIDRAVVAVEGIAEKKNVRIEVPHTELIVHVDDDRIIQVLVNLLSNAIKFSTDNDTVEISCEAAASSVLIRIIDHGRGVPVDLQQTIFEKYKQVELNDSKQKGGTGLGLPICRAIIEEHGGLISVTSAGANQGSTFWFTLPLAQKAAPVEESDKRLEPGDFSPAS